MKTLQISDRRQGRPSRYGGVVPWMQQYARTHMRNQIASGKFSYVVTSAGVDWLNKVNVI